MSREPEILILRDVLLPGGRIADITISDGIVIHTGSAGRGEAEIRCTGKTLLPAATDLHVHMRDGQQKGKETFESGTKSALAGGVTMVVDQPNTLPPLTTPERIRERVTLAKNQVYCRFGINGGVTSEADIQGMWQAGAVFFGETFAGPSSYGEEVNEGILTQTMHIVSGFHGVMSIHAEQVSEGVDSGLVKHDYMRSPEGEAAIAGNICQLNQAGCRLYFCHLSAPGSIQKITPKQGIIEVTPHHLFLSYEQFDDDNTHAKVNPPLRSERIRKELFSQWSRIDVIASDHAPHTIQEKADDFISAPSGIPGVETMVPLLMSWEREKKISMTDIIEKTSHRPSHILQMNPAGYYPGNRADFALYSDELTVISPEILHSKAGWTPFEGLNAIFPDIVILGGAVVLDNGEFSKPSLSSRSISENGSSVQNDKPSLWFPGRGYSGRERIVW